ncbi:MAG: hypothetical protein PVJ57_12975 [Phycisphaerae bacterium]
MFAVTDAAAARLHEMAQGAPEGKTLRLGRQEGRLEFKWDEQKPEDEVVTHNENTVLVFDAMTAEFLSGKTMDLQSAGGRPALTLT